MRRVLYYVDSVYVSQWISLWAIQWTSCNLTILECLECIGDAKGNAKCCQSHQHLVGHAVHVQKAVHWICWELWHRPDTLKSLACVS